MPIKDLECPGCGFEIINFFLAPDEEYPACEKCSTMMAWKPSIGMMKTIGETGEIGSNSDQHRHKKPLQPFDGGRRKDESDALGKL